MNPEPVAAQVEAPAAQEEKEIFKCDICQGVFNELEAFGAHLDTHEPGRGNNEGQPPPEENFVVIEPEIRENARVPRIRHIFVDDDGDAID